VNGLPRLVEELTRIERLAGIATVLAEASPVDGGALLAAIDDTLRTREAQRRPHEAALLRFLRPFVEQALPRPAGTAEDVVAALAGHGHPLAQLLAVRRSPVPVGSAAVAAARRLAAAGPHRPDAPERFALTYAILSLLAGSAGDRADARLVWANVLRRRHRHARAGFHARRAVEASDGNTRVVALGTLAAIHRDSGDLPGAIAVLDAALREAGPAARLSPGQRIVLRRLVAGDLRRAGRFREALDHVGAALDALPAGVGGDRTRYDLVRLRGLLHGDVAEHDYAATDFQQAAGLARRLGERELELSARASLATSLASAGRHPAAVRAFHRIVDDARQWGSRGALAAALNNLANFELDWGDPTDAERHFGEALALGRTDKPGYSAVISLLGLGDAAGRHGEHAGAALCYRLALDTGFRSGHGDEASVLVANRIGTRTDDPADDATEDALRDLVDRGATRGRWTVYQEAGLALAAYLLRHGRADEAHALRRRLLDEAVRRDSVRDVINLRLTLARGLAGGRVGRQEAFEQVWLARAEVTGLMARAGDHTRHGEIAAEHIGVYEALIDLLLDGDLRLPDARPADELAYDLHEEAKSRTFLAEMADGPIPVPGGLPSALVDREAALLTRRADLRRELAERAGAARRRTLDELAAAAAELADVHRAIADLAPGYARLRRAEPATLAVVRELLARHAPDEGMALVSFFCGRSTTTCFTVTSGDGRLSVYRVGRTAEELAAVVTRLRTAFNGDAAGFPPLAPVHPRRPHRRDLAFLDAVGPELAGFMAAVGDRPLVCVAPHGPLHLLPLHALPDASGVRLARRAAFCYAPSVSLLAHALARPAHRPASAAVVGVAAREDPRPEAFERDAAILRDAGWRVTEVAGPAATRAAALAALAGSELAHVTAHGYVEPRTPMNSGLVLADHQGRPSKFVGELPPDRRRQVVLRARDLAEVRMRVRLLTLRACSSGWHAAEHAGDEFSGLTRALLRAGAAATISALWNVDQDSSGELLREFYRSWRDGVPLWRAMWRAQRTMMEDPDRPWLRHPYHWAALVVVGDWR
jgi:tetratricopeptide (TPR) repeat protein